jgi:dTDP-glucose 4,6-dehydratase
MKLQQCWLVTGGAGFIGSHFARLALSAGHRVLNMDALTYAGNLHSIADIARHPNYSFMHADIGDSASVAQALAGFMPTAVVNFAAESHVDRSIDGPKAFLQTNVMSTLNLLENARDYWKQLATERQSSFRFLHVSTDEVYGSLGDTGAFTETTPYAPNSPYSASKAASDHLVRAFHHTYGLPTLTTNCSNNYGPYQFPEKLIPVVIQKALTGQPLPIYGDGKNIRDWLYVGDHCQAIMRVLEAGRAGETYNIGGNAEQENIAVVQAICRLLDAHKPRADDISYTEQMQFVKDRPGHDRRYAIDASKIKNELGWQPSLSFHQGIELTVKWYLDNQVWVNHILSGDYRIERVGEGI